MTRNAVLFLSMFLIFCVPSYVTKNAEFDAEKEIILNEKVGSVIDPEVRTRYNMFPDLSFSAEGGAASVFTEARFYRYGKGGYSVRLVTTEGTYQARNDGAKAVAILQDYFVCYDSIVYYNSKKKFEEKWKIVDYDNLGQPITIDEVERLTIPNPRLKYGGLGAMIGGAVIGGFAGFAIGTWTNMLGGCLGGVGGPSDTLRNSVWAPTLTCAGLGAVPGAAAMVTAEVIKKKYGDALSHIKRQRMPYPVPDKEQ